MQRRPGLWSIGFIIIVLAALVGAAALTAGIDPFFHYRKPKTDKYFYTLDNQRSQNDGILKHFDYEGVITGTSMAQNFKTSEAEELWGIPFVKTTFSGATFREINDSLLTALRSNPNLHIVIQGLDMNRFTFDKDRMRLDLGDYPTYLYDRNPFNDVKYVLNRDVLFSRVFKMVRASRLPDAAPGITSFDQYSSWSADDQKCGKSALYPDGVPAVKAGKPVALSPDLRKTVTDNVRQNLTSLAEAYPSVTFYYFFTPYSAHWWQDLLEDGTIYQQTEAERIVIEELLKYDNIRLFSFNNLTAITTDLNNYKDIVHYGEWINSMMLRYMRDDALRLTQDNYEAYLEEELRFYTTFDYSSMNGQEDYADDSFGACLYADENYPPRGTEIALNSDALALSHAEVAEDLYRGRPGVVCRGRLERDPHAGGTATEYMWNTDYVGFKVEIEDVSPYKLLVFRGRKLAERGQPAVYVYDETGKVVAECYRNHKKIDEEWHAYHIDLSGLSGSVTVIFNGGYVDKTGSRDSQYAFSGVTLF